MAKMFYTIDEAAAKLGKSAGEVRTMIEKGQFSEYRQQGQLVIKASQVDQMVGGDADDSAIPLADSGEIPIAEDPKAGSSGANVVSSETGTKERSGISIFEADELEEADASAQTQVTQSVQGLPTGDPGASGSGLGLTRNEDTSLGAGLLEDVYGKGDSGIAPAVGAGGGLFESTGVASDASMAPAMAMVVAEPYDGTWSGIAGGLALAMTIIVALCTGVVVLSLNGGGLGMFDFLRDNLMPVLGGMAVLALVCAGVGFFLGKKS